MDNQDQLFFIYARFASGYARQKLSATNTKWSYARQVTLVTNVANRYQTNLGIWPPAPRFGT